jgi:hypothetical protein
LNTPSNEQWREMVREARRYSEKKRKPGREEKEKYAKAVVWLIEQAKTIAEYQRAKDLAMWGVDEDIFDFLEHSRDTNNG